MKIKLLTISTAILLTLTACGGGGSSSSDNSNNNSSENPSAPTAAFQQWFTFNLDSYSAELSFDSETTTVDNGKLYTAGDIDTSFMVTANGLYDQGPSHSAYGPLQGSISINNNIWTLSPYSSINAAGLNFETTVQLINLEGASLASKIDLYNYWVLKNNIAGSMDDISNQAQLFLTAMSTVKFPSGSKCLQITKISNSEQYLDLYDSPSSNSQSVLANLWNSLILDPAAKKYIMKDTIAYTLNNNFESGIAQYKNRFYDAYLAPKGVEYDIQSFLTEFDTWANQAPTAAEKNQFLELKTLAQNSCTMYNDVAINAIKQNFANYK
ncbi:hypothetical protein [Acinetobacter tianfuensis]|uniref:Uncharacterized protein n=1 Tax=Acinetobacter tianfuensis TaxID=2419603 RepID=A0A3A8EQ91_9GAMM|nr:hypothetical protein [Acinetobacter tianfuensis]RKG31051.1 hypothetical protein D7V32_09195 [Acinetobacter tianfuensis]